LLQIALAPAAVARHVLGKRRRQLFVAARQVRCGANLEVTPTEESSLDEVVAAIFP
jgi:hypothetical protein